MLGQFLYAEVWSLTLHKTIKRLCQPHPHKARKGKERARGNGTFTDFPSPDSGYVWPWRAAPNPTPVPTLRFLRDWLPQLGSHCCKLHPPWLLSQGSKPWPIKKQSDLYSSSEPLTTGLVLLLLGGLCSPWTAFWEEFCSVGTGEPL